ncbi:retrovirus-related pol polyprotein from transposon TNT 1-94 [Tanacetum coccineum]
MAAGQRKPETQWTPEERKAASFDQRLKSLIMSVLLDDQMNSKWLAFCQILKNTNHVKEPELASLFGKLKYKQNLINSIYDTNKEKTLVPTTPLATAFFYTSIVLDIQDSLDDEEDTRSIQEYMNDLEEEYQARALLAKPKRFFKKSTQRFSSAKATDQTKCHKCGKKGHFARDCWSKTSVPLYQSPFQPKLLYSPEHKLEPRHTKDFEAKYNKVKAKLSLLSSSTSTPSLSRGKNKGLIAEMYDWDEEEVSSDDNKVIEVKALMALADEERVSIGKESARNGEWIKISMKKHVNTEILKENQNLRNELKELTSITKAWLNSSNKVNQCISEKIPTQKKKILGIDQLTEDTFSFGPKDLIFVESSADNVSITNSNQPRLSEAENSTILNHGTGKIPSVKSQTNTTDPSVAVTESLATNYDSADESLDCSTPLHPLKKLNGAELVSGPKTIKSILKSKSTFKAETLKVSYWSRIISLRRGIKPRNPQHVTKNCETCASNVHTTADHNDNEWFRKREALQAKKGKAPQVSSPTTLDFRLINLKEAFQSTKKCQGSAEKYDINGSSMITLMVPPNMLGPNLNGKAINETQYRANLKESHLIAVKRTFYTLSLGLQYPKRSGFNLKGYSDSDCAGYNMDRKSTLAKAEDVVVAGCCANILWIKSHLTDYDIIYEKIKNHTLKRDIEFHFIPTQYQLADILIKLLDKPSFKRLIDELGMLNIDSKPEASVLTKEN